MNKERKKSSFSQILLAGSIIFAILMVFTMMVMQHENNIKMIEETCFMYTRNGVPESIIIDNTTYNLKENGEISDIDKVFLNPYHRQLLAEQKCIEVNLSKK
jgi:hypothetical protein